MARGGHPRAGTTKGCEHRGTLMARAAQARTAMRGGAEADAPPPPRVMFVCRANSCRSQMAHGLFNKLTDGSSGASCGFRASELNPHAVAVMAEIGIDISEHTSNAIAEYDPSAFDAIICVCGCAAEVPGEWKVGHFEDWSLDDPPELDPGDRSVYRRVRDELIARSPPRRGCVALPAGAERDLPARRAPP